MSFYPGKKENPGESHATNRIRNSAKAGIFGRMRPRRVCLLKIELELQEEVKKLDPSPGVAAASIPVRNEDRTAPVRCWDILILRGQLEQWTKSSWTTESNRNSLRWEHEGFPSLFFNQPVEFPDQTVDFRFEIEDSVPVVVMILPLIV